MELTLHKSTAFVNEITCIKIKVLSITIDRNIAKKTTARAIKYNNSKLQ